MTLAVEVTNLIPTDEANRAILGILAIALMLVAPTGGQFSDYREWLE